MTYNNYGVCVCVVIPFILDVCTVQTVMSALCTGIALIETPVVCTVGGPMTTVHYTALFNMRVAVAVAVTRVAVRLSGMCRTVETGPMGTLEVYLVLVFVPVQ